MARRFFSTGTGASALAATLGVADPAPAATLFPDGYVAAVMSGAARLAPLHAAIPDPAVLGRIVPADYADGVAAPAGPDRPAPRAVVGALAATPEARRGPDARPLNALAVVAGQTWISHELAHTPTLPGPENTFELPGAPDGPPLRLQRAAAVGGTGPGDPREQTNIVFPLFTASIVYGSDAGTAQTLRELDGSGRMKVGPDGGLPLLVNGLPTAGDRRAFENVVLESMHVLFRDEHNRLAGHVAGECADLGLACNDEQIFRMAANLNTAVQQRIVFEELLPAVLGGDDLLAFLPDPTLAEQPFAVFNEATTAALRVWHSMVPDTIWTLDAAGARGEVDLADCFFNRDCLAGVPRADILHGAAAQPAKAVDGTAADALALRLMTGPGELATVSLFEISLARGRDHGLASFETICAGLGFAVCEVPDHLRAIYGPASVDAFAGLLSEPRGPDDHIGPVTAALLALQFHLMRAHDPNFFDAPGMFDAATRDWIAGTGFADVLGFHSDHRPGWHRGGIFHAPAHNADALAAVAPVPLPPAGLLLLLGGGLTLGALARRRRAGCAA